MKTIIRIVSIVAMLVFWVWLTIQVLFPAMGALSWLVELVFVYLSTIAILYLTE